MARFYGEIGFSAGTSEVGPGVHEESLVEYKYRGDILRNTRKMQEDQTVNPAITVQNSISVVADAYARDHFFAMRYIRWQGTLWVVTDVEVQGPRLVLRLGGIYNGPVGSPGSP